MAPTFRLLAGYAPKAVTEAVNETGPDAQVTGRSPHALLGRPRAAAYALIRLPARPVIGV